MAKLRYRLSVFKEVADDFLAIGIVADVLRCSSSRNHEGCVITGVHVCKCEIGVPAVPGLFRVRVVTLFKIMYHESQFFLAWRGNMNLVPLLFEPLIGIHHLKGLGGITGQNQNLWLWH